MNKENKNKTLDWIIKIILIVVIIFLLIHNCTLMKKNKEYENNPSGNTDTIEIVCDNNRCKPKEIESLVFLEKTISIGKGEVLNLIVTVKPSELADSKLVWKSSNTNIVTVDSDGIIKGINTGKATITAISENGKIATCEVEVVDGAIGVKKIELIADKVSINEGSITQISTLIEPKNATNRELVWTSSDSKIAMVNSKGVVKGIKKGTATITVKTKNGKVVASIIITVNAYIPKVESISFSQNNISIKKDDTLGLTIIVKPNNVDLKDFTWKSSNPNIVTVDSNGVIKGLNVGETTITVTSSNGKTATCTVNVTTDDIDVKEITLRPIDRIMGVDNTTQIIAEIKPQNATNRELVWTSSDDKIATVDSNGVVKGIKNGVVTITAKTKDGKVVATTTITIDDNINIEELNVYDNDHTPVTWNGTNDLKIFGSDGIIAPENTGSYQFDLKNGTKFVLKYNINFIENNPYNINLKFKLKKNDTYLIDHYVSASELNVSDILLNSNQNDKYYLEWKWVSSDNDTLVGKNINSNYELKIEVKAESTND